MCYRGRVAPALPRSRGHREATGVSNRRNKGQEFRVYSSLTRQTDQHSPISRSWRATSTKAKIERPSRGDGRQQNRNGRINGRVYYKQMLNRNSPTIARVFIRACLFNTLFCMSQDHKWSRRARVRAASQILPAGRRTRVVAVTPRP
eukprot:scaffold6407_cov62-Phaeocystis_antarctica.AAC.8